MSLIFFNFFVWLYFFKYDIFMIKKIILLLICFCFIFSGCGKKTTENDDFANVIKRDKLVVGVRDDAPPFGFKDEKGNPYAHELAESLSDMADKLLEKWIEVAPTLIVKPGYRFSVIVNREIAMPVIWFDPLEEPMTLLIFSIILGAIHLFVGMGIQAYMLIKDGKPWDALFDIGFWYMLIIGLVLFALGGSVAAILSTIGMWLAIVGAVGILLTGGRNKKGFGKITGGLGSLYGITSYLSDALSYSRLLALGLATGVVAKVVNILGSLAGSGIVGLIVFIAVFLFGTVFNLAINVLGAYVHSCRLQYVEFFGKFYTGGGKGFVPLTENTKFVKIINKED